MLGLIDFSELLESGLQAIAAVAAVVLGLVLVGASLVVDSLLLWGLGLIIVGILLAIFSVFGVIDAIFG